MKLPVLLLYGLDEASLDIEVASAKMLADAAYTALTARGWQVEPVQVEHDLVGALKPYSPEEWVVLNLCEGAPSQAFYYAKTSHILSVMGFTFTGSDHIALDHTQFKWKMKSLLNRYDVPTPRWAIVNAVDDLAGASLPAELFPAIVKPAGEHCSYGITRDSVVMDAQAARAQAARVIREFHGPALIEQFLDSAEYNVSVWGSSRAGSARVLGISTMTYDAFGDIRDRLCTFEAKWDPTSEPYQRIPAICPAPLPETLKAEIEAASIAAYTAIGVRDYGRIDLRLLDGHPMVLDVNPNCDVCPDAGLATAAAVAGYDYGQMMEQILLFALERREDGIGWPSAADGAEKARAPLRRTLVAA